MVNGVTPSILKPLDSYQIVDLTEYNASTNYRYFADFSSSITLRLIMRSTGLRTRSDFPSFIQI